MLFWLRCTWHDLAAVRTVIPTVGEADFVCSKNAPTVRRPQLADNHLRRSPRLALTNWKAFTRFGGIAIHLRALRLRYNLSSARPGCNQATARRRKALTATQESFTGTDRAAILGAVETDPASQEVCARRARRIRGMKPSMPEMPGPGEHHGDAVRIGSVDHFLVAH